MAKNDIFAVKDYRSYLNESLLARAQQEKGQRLKLARFISCNPAYLTRILDGRNNLSPDQAQSVNDFLKHSNAESRYFLTLVLLERAGTKNLKAHFQDELKKMREERLVLKNRIQQNRTLSEVDQARYYSSWHYAAIHMAVSLNELKTKEQLLKALRISNEMLNETLDFLVNIGLLKAISKGYARGETHIFIDVNSPFIGKHHTNWRLKAIQSLDEKDKEDFHYSGVITCSMNDRAKIKEAMIKTVQEIRNSIKDSPDETLCAYTLDLFKLA